MQTADLEQFIKTNYINKPTNLNLSADYQLTVTCKGGQVIARCVDWPIQRINLSMYKLESEGLQHIVNNNKWIDLSEIILNQTHLVSESLINISKCQWNIKKICLDKNKISHQGFKELVGCNWSHLQQLSLSYNNIGEDGALAISQSNWPELTTLNLNFNIIGNKGVKCICSMKWDNMRRINLSNNKLDSTGMYYLKHAKWPQLQSLILNRNYIGKSEHKMTDIGCVYLTQMKSNNISQLSVFGNAISLNGVILLIRCSRLKENCFMELARNQFRYKDILSELVTYNRFCNNL